MLLKASHKNTCISGLTADSRIVKPGYLFAALPGQIKDGRSFIKEALDRGASAFLVPLGTRLPLAAKKVPVIGVANPRRSLAFFAARFYKLQPQIAAAVTGTNGKTSVSWFTYQIWKKLGHASATMGTLGTIKTTAGNSAGTKLKLTTADPVTLHKKLKTFFEFGINRVVLEASSHGLEQSRLDGVKFLAGAFTNISHDHLDYHRTMKSYRSAKLKLFETVLPENSTAVLNADSKDYPIFQKVCQKRGLKVISYGQTANEIRILQIKPEGNGQRLWLSSFGKQHELYLKLPGEFQIYNALCALGLCIACGDKADDVITVFPELESPPGRLELIGHLANGASIYIDYAHTPDALTSLLLALRPRTSGALKVVFGCGGNRDQRKRRKMGYIAHKLADEIIITDDNPRAESPEKIRKEILSTCPKGIEIDDRADAIKYAISKLSKNDVLVVTGKGHEKEQVIGDRVLPFDDAAIIRANIQHDKDEVL